MAWTVKGRIESTGGDNVSLAECRVEVSFEQNAPVEPVEIVGRRAPGAPSDKKPGKPSRKPARGGELPASGAPSTIPGRASAKTNASGEFEVTLPDRTELMGRALRVVVSAPSGETIADDFFTYNAINDAWRIPVRPVETIVLKPPTDAPKPEAYRVTGKVVERNGKMLPSNLQVLLLARKRGERAANDAEDRPVLVARADGSGYFFGDVPNQEYEHAVGVVAGFADGIPVPLEKGRFPAPVLLVVELPEAIGTPPKKDDCHCDDPKIPPRAPTHSDIDNAPETYSVDLGTGRCVQFNTPNRAIEEFDFYTVVRTTEPGIRGLTIADADFMSPDGYAPESVALGPAAEAGAAEAAAEAAETAAATAAAEAKAADAGASAQEAAATAMQAAAKASGDAAALGIAASVTASAKAARATATAKAAAARLAAAAAQAKRSAANAAAARAAVAARAEAEAVAARAAAEARAAARAAAAAAAGTGGPQGREELDASNPVDWDSTPTFYEAATIAHGHLLHFKQVWYADGYSLGDLLYSLPLAPGQKKLISVVDWERRERTERSEATFGSEELNAALSRDRDLGEVVTGTLTESARGGSKSTSAGVGVGTGAAGNGSYGGFNFGALIGVSGGYGESDSSAWQDSARNLSSNSLQTLRDRTLQSASAVRGLRSSVVHTVSQGEAVRATTEVVANHNHCHAITIQYFEVLRHLKLVHELADVQECLFIPFPMSEFDLVKALRWRQPLQTYLQRRELVTAFDAARRVETAWTQVDFPVGRYADESITSLSGELLLTVLIPLPPFPERPKPNPEDAPLDAAKKISDAVNPTTGFLGIALAIFSGGASLVAGAATDAAISATKAAAQGARALADELYAQPTAKERYDKFQYEVVPGVVQGFVDQLELWALVGADEVRIDGADFTLVSEYQPGSPLLVALRGTTSGQMRRAEVSQLIIKSANGLPGGCRAIVNSATIRYRTSMFEHAFVDDPRVNDDLDLPKVTAIFLNPFDFTIQQLAPGKGAALYTPIDAWEQRSPRTEDRRLSSELVEHLNDNLEFYHHAIWWTMDPNRRYMLLDGYLAPGSKDRSVASVVENRLIGIIGNSFVLPVARGNQLDPRFRVDPTLKSVNLTDFYSLKPPVPPARVSLPTRGVFAEAVMGSCNACEQIDDSKFWRWEDSPIDEPPSIEPASTATRRAEPASTQPTPFPTPIVSIQNAPSVPDPAGVRAALDTISKQSFADITGLAGTQANAAAAYSQALDTAFKFGKEASTLAQQAAMINAKDKTLGAIDSAQEGGKIDAKDAKDLRVKALRKMVGDTPADEKASSVADRLKVIDDQEAKGSITKDKASELRDQVMKGLDAENAPKNDEQQATTETIRKIPGEAVESVETKDASGASTTIRAKPATSSEDTSGGGGSGGVFGVLNSILSASPGVTRSPIIAFDTANPSDEAVVAAASMAADDALGTALSARMESYIDRFGFDRSKSPIIRGPGIREPWKGITTSDLDAVIAVGNAIGISPAHVLAVWIAEGKLAVDSLLHGGTLTVNDKPPEDFAGASGAQILAFARSEVLYQFFGADPMTAFVPHGAPNGDNLILGPKNGHNAAFDRAIDEIRAAGISGFQARTNSDIREFFTTLGGGLIAQHTTTKGKDVVNIRLGNNSLASWLWLQASLFQATRVKLEKMLSSLYGGVAVDLADQPWATYLFWNTNKTADVVDQYYRAATVKAALARRFGSQTVEPDHLNDDQLTRYYATGGSTAAWANAVMVKFLVETVDPWFK